MTSTTWNITLNDRVSANAQRAARELAALQRSYQSAKLAERAYNRDGSVNSAVLARGLGLQRRAILEAASAHRAVGAEAARAQRQYTQHAATQTRAMRQGAEELAMGFGMAATAAATVTTAVVAAAAAVADLVARLGAAVLEMIRFREGAVTTMGMMLGGRGAGIQQIGGAAVRQAIGLGRISPSDSRDIVRMQQQVAAGGFTGAGRRRALAAAMDVQAINSMDSTSGHRFLIGLSQMRGRSRLSDQDLRQTAEAAGIGPQDVLRRAAGLAGINRRTGETDRAYERRIEKARRAGRITGQHGVTAVEQELSARTGQGLGGASRNLGQNSLSGAITNLTGAFGEMVISMDNIENSPGLQGFRRVLVELAGALNGTSASGRAFQGVVRGLIDNGFGAIGRALAPGTIERVFGGIINGAQRAMPYLRAFARGFGAGFAGTLPAISAAFRALFGLLSGGGGQGTIAFIFRVGQGLGQIVAVATMVTAAIVAAVGALTAFTNAAAAFLVSMVATITDSISAFTALGGQIVDGLITGLRNAWGRLTGELSALAQSLPGPVRDALGIRSPSRVFAELGRQLPAGMALGIESGTDRVSQAVNNMVSVPGAPGAAAVGARGPLVNELHIHVGGAGEDLAETVRVGVLDALTDLFDQAAAMEGA